MIFRRIFQNLRNHDWSIVVFEVLLLAIGLLAAFQVDRWWEQRAEFKNERIYIQRLIENVQADIPHIEFLIELQSMRLGYADLLIDVSQDPALAAERPGEFLAAVIGASYTIYPTLRSYTFEDLRSTGNMTVIRSPEVKAALYGYYEYGSHHANFREIFLSNEFRHWELAAGILDPGQAKWLQDNRIFALPSNVEMILGAKHDPDEVMASAERLAARQGLIDWLPQVREMQVYMVFYLERQIALAHDVLAVLQAYAGEIGAG